MMRWRYQRGCFSRTKRKAGPDCWEFPLQPTNALVSGILKTLAQPAFSSPPGPDEQSDKKVGKGFQRRSEFGVRSRSPLPGTGDSMFSFTRS
jgi:hypothetical protein